VWTRVAIGAAVLALFVGIVWVLQSPAKTASGTIAVLINEDANVAANGLESSKQPVTDAAVKLAADGGGRLVIVKASGGPAREITDVDLAVEGPDGQPEHDRETIEAVAADRIKEAFDAAEKLSPEGSGRDIVSLLRLGADQAPPAGQSFDVFIVGFGLGTVDPADARIQMGGDPRQAVQAMAERLPKLIGADLHVTFPAAVAPQEPLNVATSAWRRAYWQDIADHTGARLVSVSDTNKKGEAAKGSAQVPVIPNLPDPTPAPPQPVPPPDPQVPPPPTTLAGSLFLPDSPEFIDPAAATVQLTPIADAWTKYSGSYRSVDCVGRTADVGDADGAVGLSQQRAERARAVLESLGVTAVTATGVGFNDPLPGIDPKAEGQRSVTCQLVLN
jgi:outer membrane protein OmpA-like peptidoglycan-associated protein